VYDLSTAGCNAALAISVVMKIKFFWVVMPIVSICLRFVTLQLEALNPSKCR
jgi:hypothetical protein